MFLKKNDATAVELRSGRGPEKYLVRCQRANATLCKELILTEHIHQ